MDKAGAHAAQDNNDEFVEKVYSDYYTVIGLPYIKLYGELTILNKTDK
jgi:predicted house-cleaning NTP pyrophosphatase (Maf/HAM1 superfamily)